MADQPINGLPKKTTVADTDALLMIGTSEEYQIDYGKLADAILNKITSKAFTLDQGSKTLVAALNELNSNISKAIKKIMLVSKLCTTTGTTGELGDYYATINLTDVPENCVAILPIGATKTDSPGYPAILAPYKWETTSSKCIIWNVISSKGGNYGAYFAYLLE